MRKNDKRIENEEFSILLFDKRCLYEHKYNKSYMPSHSLGVILLPVVAVIFYSPTKIQRAKRISRPKDISRTQCISLADGEYN